MQVEFDVLTSGEILKRSVREINNHLLYSKHIPNSRGPNSLFLGTTDNSYVCATCGRGPDSCTGHYGHIELARPVYNPLFIGNVLKILRIVCFWCSGTLKDIDISADSRSSAQSRLTIYANLSKNVHECPKCKGPQPRYAKKGIKILCQWDSDQTFDTAEERDIAEKTLTAEKVHSILRLIDADLREKMGISHPEAMVMEYLTVPPVLMRPSVCKVSGSNIRGQDDLTTKLGDIVRTNKRLRESESEEDLNKFWEMLQFFICVYIDKEPRFGKAPKKNASGRTSNIKSIVNRLSGKRGRLRANMMGKRVNFSSRSVLRERDRPF
jgi:DNA-directed RNA polymerase beta' subunit